MDFIIENNILTKYCGSADCVLIPDGVAAIGAEAFADAQNLSSVFLPDSVRWIADGAFRDCAALTEVSLGTNIDYGHRFAFSGCSRLKELSLRDNNKVHHIPFCPSAAHESDLLIRRAMLTGSCGPESVYLYDGHTLWICGTGIVKPLFSLLKLEIVAFDNFEDYNEDIPYWYDSLETDYSDDIRKYADSLRQTENSAVVNFGRYYPHREEYYPHGCFSDERDFWYVEEVRIQEGITELACGALNPLFAIVEHEEFNCTPGESLCGPGTIYIPQSLHRIGPVPYDAALMGNVLKPLQFEMHSPISREIELFGEMKRLGWVEQIAGKQLLSHQKNNFITKLLPALLKGDAIDCGNHAKVQYHKSREQLVISGSGMISVLYAKDIPAKSVIIDDGITGIGKSVRFPDSAGIFVVPKELNVKKFVNPNKCKILRRGVDKFIKLRCFLGI